MIILKNSLLSGSALLLLFFLTSCQATKTTQPQPVTSETATAQQSTPAITLAEMYEEYKYFPESVSGFNFTEGSRYLRTNNNVIQEVDFNTDEVISTRFDYNKVRQGFGGDLPEKFSGYTFDDDGSHLLVGTDRESIFRRSSRANFFIYDFKEDKLVPLDPEGKQMNATFSPDGTKVAYARDNNLYIYDLRSGRRTPVTTDGKKNSIINGTTDWVYEEEFAIVQVFEWSPDSKSLLYLKFDESKVPEYVMPMHHDEAYPEFRTWKYPKVGEENASVSAHVYTFSTKRTREIFDSHNGDTHVPRIYYTPAGEPMLWVTNRRQNQVNLLYEPKPGAALDTLLSEESRTYIDVTDDLTFLKDGSFLWTSDRDGYNHIYHVSKNGEEIRQLTSGNYPVTSFYGYDPANRQLYFQAAMQRPTQREVYRLSIDGGSPQRMTTKPGWNSATFTKDFSGYLLTYSNINTPSTYEIYSLDGDKIRTLETNERLKRVQREEKTGTVSFFDFETERGDKLNGWRMVPEGFDESGDIDYPVLMFVYGGPGSQTVKDQWQGLNYWWFQMLTQMGYVVVSVDNRGTGARGADFQKGTYLALGKQETEDQISAARYLGRQNYIDADRIGIFGWSYGGYMSTLAILKGADIFSTAIAVAPVTNWKWYDSLYTERYMRTTKDNKQGYLENSPVYFADRLEGKYLLVHGMGDDNVHYQHSAEMAKALVLAGKDFEFVTYPNRAHGLWGGKTRIHLYRKMTNFLRENL